jgi:SagB-type dehydrogenase family enzyme
MNAKQEVSPAPHFDDFTKASELHHYNARQFADQVRSYVPTQQLRTLHTASADHLLHQPSDAHQRLLADRKSTRKFSSTAMDAEQLGSLLSGLAASPDGRRSFPSAGGLYPVEVVVAVANVADVARQVAVYHPDTHALGWIAELPIWDDWKEALGSGVETEPPVTVFFCVDPSAMLGKYGERGGRFVLLEVGHTAQVVAERAVVAGLGGYSVGGLLERNAQRLFGFDRLATAPIPLLAYACGRQESGSTRPGSIANRGGNSPETRGGSLLRSLSRVRSAMRAMRARSVRRG